MRENECIDEQPRSVIGSPAYTVRAVAERIGVPTPTLRSWNLRYGIGPQQHEAGRHRHYTERDISVLEQMVELIRSGVSPASAALTARTASGAVVPDIDDTAPAVDAAFRLDTTGLVRLVDNHVRHHGVVTTWDRLCRPAFDVLVARQSSIGGCIDVEHALSWAVMTSLRRITPPPVEQRPAVVLACTRDEWHSLPLEALRAALAEVGVGARMLGPDVPAEAIADALTRLSRPATVALWSHAPTTADPSAVSVALAAGARVVLAGGGWDGIDTPPTAARIGSLTAAVTLLAA